MSEDRTPDPQPRDFDRELDGIDPDDLQDVPASDERQLVVQFTVRGEDAVALERIAHQRGEEPGQVVAELIREASRPAV